MEALSINAPALLRELTRTGGVTRLELQTALDVSGPTVTRTILELGELGLVESTVTAAGAKGRPAETVDLASGGLCSIAVSIRAERVTVSLVDARGRQVKHQALPVSEETDYAEAIGLIGQAVLETVSDATARFRCLAGVGISFGGSADYETGTITTPSAFQRWRGKPLARDLEFYTGLPCAIDNYSFALVEALNWFDAAKRSDFFLVVADYGIGGVSSIGDQAYLGPERRPAGFGHIGSRSKGRFVCHCGGYDCLTATCSLKSLIGKARDMGLAPEKAHDLAALVRSLDASQAEAASLLLSDAAGRIADSALAVCRGLGLMSCVFGGMLFDCSAHARAAVGEVFAAPGHGCAPRFLAEAFDTRSPDDLAAAAVAYHRLSDKRQVLLLDGRFGEETIRLRRTS